MLSLIYHSHSGAYDSVWDLHSYLCSQVRCICRNIVNNEKERFRNFMRLRVGTINLNSDLWLSINTTDSYLCFTAHFINNDLRLHKKMLNFCIVPPPHVSVALCEQVYGLLLSWNIEDDSFALKLENSTSMMRLCLIINLI